MNLQITPGCDWFESHIPYWKKYFFDDLKWNNKIPHTVIEIGSFEGLSSVWILNNLLDNKESQLYCIDTFEGSVEMDQSLVDSLYERFQNNIQTTNKVNQVVVQRGFSQRELPKLIVKDIKADFIYIDGSHLAKDVLTDAVMAWQMLASGGTMIFDDYHWGLRSDNVLKHPKYGVDSFVNCFYEEIKFIFTHQNYQYYIQKI